MLDFPFIHDAWQSYVTAGSIARQLRPMTRRAWERAHDFRVDPRQFHAHALSEVDTDRLLRSQEPFVTAARPFLCALSRAAGGERHAAMLGDAHGVVLDVVGDDQTARGPERVPGPGALLSEEVTGANGIGSPLAEQGYAEFVGPEHFIGGFHPFTCQGTVIRDAGRVIGVLSTSVRRPEASRRLHDILVCAAHGIEAELLSARLQEKIRRVLQTQAGDAHVLEDLRQDVMQHYASAKLRLEAAAQVLPQSGPGYAMELLQSASEAMAAFHQQATLWQDLASSDRGAVVPLKLAATTSHIAQLLQTEMAIRGTCRASSP